MITPPEVVRIGEAARILGVCLKTLRNWDKQDKLKPNRTSGGHRLYRTAELEKILEERHEVAG